MLGDPDGSGRFWNVAVIVWLLLAAWVNWKLKGRRVIDIPGHPAIGDPNWRKANRGPAWIRLLSLVAGLILMLFAIYTSR